MPVQFNAKPYLRNASDTSAPLTVDMVGSWPTAMEKVAASPNCGWASFAEALRSNAIVMFDKNNQPQRIEAPAAMDDSWEALPGLIKAGNEGRLFILNKDTRSPMQVKSDHYITEPEDDGWTFDVSVPLAVPEAKPVRPSIWTYLLSFFIDSYAQEVEAYNESLREYNMTLECAQKVTQLEQQAQQIPAEAAPQEEPAKVNEPEAEQLQAAPKAPEKREVDMFRAFEISLQKRIKADKPLNDHFFAMDAGPLRDAVMEANARGKDGKLAHMALLQNLKDGVEMEPEYLKKLLGDIMLGEMLLRSLTMDKDTALQNKRDEENPIYIGMMKDKNFLDNMKDTIMETPTMRNLLSADPETLRETMGKGPKFRALYNSAMGDVSKVKEADKALKNAKRWVEEKIGEADRIIEAFDADEDGRLVLRRTEDRQFMVGNLLLSRYLGTVGQDTKDALISNIAAGKVDLEKLAEAFGTTRAADVLTNQGHYKLVKIIHDNDAVTEVAKKAAEEYGDILAPNVRQYKLNIKEGSAVVASGASNQI